MNQLSRRSFLKVAGAAGVMGSGMVLAGCDSGTKEPAADDTADDTAEEEPARHRVRARHRPRCLHAQPGLRRHALLGHRPGYFEEVGITVETEQFQAGPAEITAMQSGSVDISQIGHGAHSLCIQGQAKIFAFDQLSQADCVVANKSHGIESGADLAGKTVGVASGTSSEIILQYVLQDAGLTVDDINTVEMDVSGMTTALISGQIDAAATWSPNTVTLEEQLGDDYLVLGTNTDYSDEVAFPRLLRRPARVRRGEPRRPRALWRRSGQGQGLPRRAHRRRGQAACLRAGRSRGHAPSVHGRGATGRVPSTPSATPTPSWATTRPSRRSSWTAARSRPRCPVEDYVLTDVITESDELYSTMA